jgi:AcrR family transcriptional regulator
MARERKFSTSDLFRAVKQLLLQHGYAGFTFSLLADELSVSRGALYKYYRNKEELITEFMLYEMKQLLDDLRGIERFEHFDEQFGFLLETILQNLELHQLIMEGQQIPVNLNGKVKENKAELEKLHLRMYADLNALIERGKAAGRLKSHLPNGLILGFIFQSIAIPNHFGVEPSEWNRSIKDVICDGMFTKS